MLGTIDLGLWYPKTNSFDLISYTNADFAGCKIDRKSLFDHIPIRCDNTSAISLSKNPIQHSRTKHIEIRYHFIRDHVQKGDIELEFVSTDSQWADILTKPLIEERFCTIRREIGMARYVDIK